MSDSDSSDNFDSLITNSEQNFWKTYATTLAQNKSSDVEAQPSSSTANAKLTSVMHAKRRMQSTSEDSSDDEFQSLQINTSKTSSATKSNKTSTNKKRPDTSSNAKQWTITTVSDASSSTALSSFDYNDNESGNTNTSTKKMSLLGAILKTLATQPASASSGADATTAATTSATVNPVENETGAPATRRSRRIPQRNVGRNKSHQRRTPKRRRKTNAVQSDQRTDESTDSNQTPDHADDDLPPTPPQRAESDAHYNRLVDVRVLWKSAHRKIFKVRRFAPLKVIVDHFARAENVEPRHVCFFLDEQIVDLSAQSCVTLRYRSTQELDGGVLDAEWSTPSAPLSTARRAHHTRLKVRSGRRIETFHIHDAQRLEQLYAGVVLKFQLKFGQFRLEFDGRVIECHETVAAAGLEPDDCIDIWE